MQDQFNRLACAVEEGQKGPGLFCIVIRLLNQTPDSFLSGDFRVYGGERGQRGKKPLQTNRTTRWMTRGRGQVCEVMLAAQAQTQIQQEYGDQQFGQQ